MPSSVVRTFTDHEHYAAAMRQATYEITVTERGKFRAKLIRIDLRVQRSSRVAPTVITLEHCGMRMDWTAAARILPLTALLVACVSQRASEKQGTWLPTAR